jgi:hypothetical protein
MKTKIILLNIVVLFVVFVACKNKKNHNPETSVSKVTTVSEQGYTKRIKLGDKEYTITDSLTCQYMHMQTDTAQHFLGLYNDTLYLTKLYTKSGGLIDAYEKYKIAVAQVDTAESFVNGISLGGTGGYQFKLTAKPAKAIKFSLYQQDGSIVTDNLDDVEITIADRNKALRVTNQLKMKWEVSE